MIVINVKSMFCMTVPFIVNIEYNYRVLAESNFETDNTYWRLESNCE
jgi:hypothetical protein